MIFLPLQYDQETLKKYQSLFLACFPKTNKFSFEYLNWLYSENPTGKALGFDAWDGDQLAAHYVCVPASVFIRGEKRNILLSLNTATHPRYQGQGLFTKLADMTYSAAAAAQFDGIYGVANSNSTPGFVKKLGFKLIQPLEAKVGWGRLDINFTNLKECQFMQAWNESSLQWRCANPNNKIVRVIKNGRQQFFAKAIPNCIQAYAELPTDSGSISNSNQKFHLSPARLFIGLVTSGSSTFSSYFDIPQKVRPSPLNFIYRSLKEGEAAPDKGSIQFSFLDFDAY